MWGVDSNKVGTSSVLILNTTNPDAITMSKQYINPNAVNTPEDSNAANGFNASENSNGNKVQPHDGTNLTPDGLSTGAKAGIIVAAVVVVRPFYVRSTSTYSLYSHALVIGHLERPCHLVLSSQKKKREN
jgi:hypothetical protein